MPEMLFVLIVLLIVLAAIMVIGHLMWIGMIGIYRAVFGRDTQPQIQVKRCVFCQRMTDIASSRCDWCGRNLLGTLASQLGDLEAFRRQLRQLAQDGLLDQNSTEKLLILAQTYHAKLLDPKSDASEVQTKPSTQSPAKTSSYPPQATGIDTPEKQEPELPHKPKQSVHDYERIDSLIIEAPALPDETTKSKTTTPAPQPTPKPPRLTPKPPPKPTPTPPPTPSPKPTPKPAPQQKPQVAEKKEPKHPIAPSPPKPPKKTWMETLGRFMEDRNIAWGELVSGILIVGASLALAVTLLQDPNQLPVFKFLIFVMISATFFGVGLYAYRRWKLVTVGRTMLIIATLMVPLNFLVMAALTKPQLVLINVAGELVALSIYLWLVWLAARVLVPESVWTQMTAVVGGSGLILLVSRLTGSSGESVIRFLAIGFLPVLLFISVVGIHLIRHAETKELYRERARSWMTFLGCAAFTLALGLGMLVYRGLEFNGVGTTLHRVAALFSLSAGPILAFGLAVMRRVKRPELVGYRTAGTSIALFAIGMMLVALIAAWPLPAALIAVSLFNAIVLVVVAFRDRIPVAHIGAIASSAIVYLVGYHLAAGNLTWAEDTSGSLLLNLVRQAETGMALVGFFLILGLVAEALARMGHLKHAVQYAGGAAVVAVASLSIVTVHGLISRGAEAPWVAGVYSFYAIGGLLLNTRFRRHALSYFGLALIVGSTLWLLWWRTGQVTPVWGMTIAIEALIMGVAAAVLDRFYSGTRGEAWIPLPVISDRYTLAETYRAPLFHVAEALLPLSLCLGLWTAWPGSSFVIGSPLHAITAMCLTGFCLFFAWGYRSPMWTYGASVIGLAGIVHTLVFNDFPAWIHQPWLAGLLGHATLAGAGAIALETLETLEIWSTRKGSKSKPHSMSDSLQRVFAGPLGDTAAVTSAASLVVFALVPWTHTWSLAGCLFWLAGIWAVIAWTKRSGSLLSAAEAVLTLATVTATIGWLERHTPNLARPVDWSDPRCFQTFGVGLALLSLAWVIVRLATRRIDRACQLLNPKWPAVDRVVSYLTVIGSLLVAMFVIVIGCQQELVGGSGAQRAITLQSATTGSTGWLLIGVLTAGLIASLWDRWSKAELIASLMLVATTVALVSCRFAPDVSTASAFRWGLSISFVLLAAIVWCRDWIVHFTQAARMKIAFKPHGSRVAQASLLALFVLPLLSITLLAAAIRFDGTQPGGPIAGSFFAGLGSSVSYVIPLVLLTGGLVGFAFRERSAGYALGAGLIIQLIVILGYLLHIATFDVREFVTLGQLSTITAAVWAIAWLTIRRRADVWRETAEPTPARWLMNVQIGMGVLGNALLLIPAFLLLAFVDPHWGEWQVAAGSWLGWIALILVSIATVVRHRDVRKRISPNLAGLIGMTALGLLACTIRGVLPETPEWGFRTLMIGWASYALFVALSTWWVAGQQTLPGAKGPPQALIRAASMWVILPGVLSVILGLKSALVQHQAEDLLWAAAGIAIAATAGATMAIWRRREGWAFAAAPGANLAASLAVCYFHRELSFDAWWALLMQANIIASAGVAFIWLAARRRLYELRDLSVRDTPLLALQTALAPTALILLLIQPIVQLIIKPSHLPGWTAQLAEPPGWIGLLLASAAAAWYVRQIDPRLLVHVVGSLLVGVGVMASCKAAQLNHLPVAEWLSFHVLCVAWAAGAGLFLAIGIIGRNLRLAGQEDPNAERATPAEPIFSASAIVVWVTTIAAVASLLALMYCLEDPGRPWWAVGTILSFSLVAGVLALWRRLPSYVYLSGLLVNAAGMLIWPTLNPNDRFVLFYVNAFCLASTSCLWTLVTMLYPGGVPALEFSKDSGRRISYPHFAAIGSLGITGLTVGLILLLDLIGVEHATTGHMGWIALGVSALSILGLAWSERSVRYAGTGLYSIGLIGLGMGLAVRSFGPRVLCWTAAPELALFTLVAAIVAWGLLRIYPKTREGVSHDREISHSQTVFGSAPSRSIKEGYPDTAWLSYTQASILGIAALLSGWISIDFAFDGISRSGLDWIDARMFGPITAVLLVGTALVMAAVSDGSNRRILWQMTTLALGGLAVAEFGWAWLDAELGLSWLHRNVILFTAAVIGAMASGFGLPRLVSDRSDWRLACQRVMPGLAGVAIVLLPLILIQEVVQCNDPQGVELAMPAVLIVAAALIGLVVVALVLALKPDWEPFGFSERGRTVYVYAAEVFVGLVALHLWLTRSDWFQFGIMKNYWMLIVMGIAFAGAALSELFHRRGVRVLSEPLERTASLLPLAPAIGVWFPADTNPQWLMAGNTPAIWLVGGLFYGFLAVVRRSPLYAFIAVVVGNIGLWVTWHQMDWHFLTNPQLYLIPLGLCLLVAEYLNHDRLPSLGSSGLRYFALALIYVSSSAEFLMELGGSWILPLVLVGLSVMGVLTGIALRIQSFVYLGLTFLMLVIVTMVCHAAFAEDQMWLFWAFCIGLGIAILILFGLFEKHRDTMLGAVKQFQNWES